MVQADKEVWRIRQDGNVKMTRIWVFAIAFDLLVIAMCTTYTNVKVTEVTSSSNVRITEIQTLKK